MSYKWLLMATTIEFTQSTWFTTSKVNCNFLFVKNICNSLSVYNSFAHDPALNLIFNNIKKLTNSINFLTPGMFQIPQKLFHIDLLIGIMIFPLIRIKKQWNIIHCAKIFSDTKYARSSSIDYTTSHTYMMILHVSCSWVLSTYT